MTHLMNTKTAARIFSVMRRVGCGLGFAGLAYDLFFIFGHGVGNIFLAGGADGFAAFVLHGVAIHDDGAARVVIAGFLVPFEDFLHGGVGDVAAREGDLVVVRAAMWAGERVGHERS